MSEENAAPAQQKPPPGAISLQVETRLGMMPMSGGAMLPGSFGELIELSKMIAASELVPKDFINKPGNVMVAIQMGLELGLAPMQAIQNIAVINGRPALWGDAMLAVVMAHPEYVDIEEMDTAEIKSAGAATCTIKRKGKADHTVTFSVDDAKKAKLWGKGGPWTQYPERMMLLRARAFACRNRFPDALRGIHSAEEAGDIPQPQEVRATVTSSAPASIAARILERPAPDAPVDETPEPEAPPVETPDAPPAEPDDSGEMTPEQEAAAFGEGTD